MESLILYAKMPFACPKNFQMLSFIKYNMCLGFATIHANTLKWLQISCNYLPKPFLFLVTGHGIQYR
jgi:hypothetical protein